METLIEKCQRLGLGDMNLEQLVNEIEKLRSNIKKPDPVLLGDFFTHESSGGRWYCSGIKRHIDNKSGKYFIVEIQCLP